MVESLQDAVLISRKWALAAAPLLLSGCATHALTRAPAAPSPPWVAAAVATTTVAPSYSVVPNNEAAVLPVATSLDPGREYDLPALIDVAQRSNPETRIAWYQARQAALDVGMVEATFLPMISASVFGGWQSTSMPQPYTDAGFRTQNSTVVPGIALQWLLFDFGQRAALREASSHASHASNVLFNGVHQKVIYDVSRTYYLHDAARDRAAFAQRMQGNCESLLKAVEERRRRGIATTLELAQAQQQLAQSNLRVVTAQAHVHEAYQGLLAAMGLSPLTTIRVASAGDPAIPKSLEAPTEAVIRAALAQRPDVLAAYANARAADAAAAAAKAEFLPKVYLAGAVASGSGRFDIQGLPGISPQTSSSTILVGISVPIFDGGLRAARLSVAKSQAEMAAEVHRNVQNAGAREIVLASDALKSALQASQAAHYLKQAAWITHDAAVDYYRNGLGTVQAVYEAENSLLAAESAHIDALAAVRVSAVTLAFSMGRLTQSH